MDLSILWTAWFRFSAQDMDMWHAVVSTLMKIWVPLNSGAFWNTGRQDCARVTGLRLPIHVVRYKLRFTEL